MKRAAATVAAVALLLAGAALVGERIWLAAKARAATALIDRAFAAYVSDGGRHRPWRWADTWPVARLEFPRLDVSRVVLAGAGGPSLAFGPGHVDGTAPPGNPGNCAIAGHRDGSFAFLRHVEVGDEVRVRTAAGWRVYRVASAEVRSMWDMEVLEQTGGDRLTLITCYPFGGWTRGTERWVVSCTPADAAAATRVPA